MAMALRLSGAQRAAVIARFCHEHPSEDPARLGAAIEEAVRDRIEDQVTVHDVDPARQLAGLKALSPPPGRYQLQGEVARGGMGVIWRVFDRVLGRPLAMKVILGDTGAASGATAPVEPTVLARFLDEAQVTGQLDHPGVVPVHELGLDATGKIYFTMRFVRGRTADAVFALARQRADGWTLTKAVEVVLKVCDTLAYAHNKGVIHRDLKPSNVMVGRFGEVYVMDWGLAKVLGQEDRHDMRPRPRDTATFSRVVTERSRQAESDPDSPVMTMDGAVIGTPSYMPPEQAAGRVDELGPRADVYAVGAMLYSLLTGRQPYVVPDAKISPYTVLGLVLQGPPTPIHRLDPTVPGELVAICDKAMARDANARYADARHLADDLRAFVENRVVKAHRTGAVAEMRAWVRRNRGVAIAAAAAALTLVAGGISSAVFWLEASAQAEIAKREGGIATQRAQEVRQVSYQAAVPAANRAFDRGEFGEANRFLESAPRELHDWEWQYLRAQLEPGAAVWSSPVRVCSPMYTLDGSSLFVAGADGRFRICDGKTLRETRSFAVSSAALDCVLPLDASGSEALVVGWQDNANVGLWRASDADSAGRRLHLAHFAETVLAWSRDHRRVVLQGRWSLMRNGEGVGVRVLSNSDDGPRATLLWHARPIRLAGFSQDGTRVVTASDDGVARIWDADTGRRLRELTGHTGPVTCACFSPDGQRVGTASGDGTARIWNASTGDESQRLGDTLARGAPRRAAFMGRSERAGHDLRDRPGSQVIPSVNSIAFSPDGQEVVTSTGNGLVCRWRADHGVLLQVYPGHSGQVYWAEFDGGGGRILSQSDDGTARLWNRAGGPEVAVFRGLGSGVRFARFSPDGGSVMVADEQAVRLYPIPNWVPHLDVDSGDGGVRAVQPCGDSPWIAVLGERAVEVWNPLTNQRLAAFPAARGGALALADGEPVLVTQDGDGLRIRHPLRGATSRLVRDGRNIGWRLSGDGHRLAILGEDGSTRILDADSGRELFVLRDPDSRLPVRCVAFSVDGSLVATGAEDRIARVFSLTDAGAKPTRLEGHDGSVWAVAVAPLGSRVATVADDNTIRLWELAHPDSPRILRSPQNETIVGLAFQPRGTRLATLAENGKLRLWDVVAGTQMLESTIPSGRGNALSFSHDGTQLFVGGDTVRIFDSVAQGERCAERTRLVAAQPDAGRLVRRVLRDASDFATAARRIRAEPTLAAPVRAMALDLLLTEMVARLPVQPR